MTQSPSIRLVTELALASRGFITLPSGGVNGNALVKSGTGLAWGSVGGGTAVNSVNGRTGAVVLAASDVGLGNANNTSDLGKPVSTATQSALNAKADYPSGGLDGQILTKSGTSTVWSTSTASGSPGVTIITTADSVATINTKLSTAGIVRFAPGTYNIGANALYIYGTTRTIVQGFGAVLNSTNNDAIFRVDNANHIIDGLTIRGSGPATDVQGGILAIADGITITRCTITNLARFAIATQGNNCRVLDNVTDSTGLGTDQSRQSVAAIFNSGDGVRIEGNTCTNTFWGITNQGASATAPISDGVIVANRITARSSASATAQGISSTYGRNQKIAHNTIRGYPGNSIDQSGAFFSVIEQNTIASSGGDGIFVGRLSTHSITVAGNNIYNCFGSGIRIWDSSYDIKVIGNSIFGLGDTTDSVGIYAAGSMNAGETDIGNVDIQGNYIDGDFQTGFTRSLGIVARNATVVDISGNTVRKVARQGIYGTTADIVTVRNNRVQDAGGSTATLYAALHASTGCNRWLLDDNVAYGTADFAVRVESGVGHRVRGSRWRNVTNGVSDSATSTLLSDNAVF